MLSIKRIWQVPVLIAVTVALLASAAAAHESHGVSSSRGMAPGYVSGWHGWHAAHKKPPKAKTAGTYHASFLCDLNGVVVGAGLNKSLQYLDWSAPEFLGALAAVGYVAGCDRVTNTNPKYISGIPWNNGRPQCAYVRLHVPYTARWRKNMSFECLL